MGKRYLDYLNESIKEKCFEFVIKVAGEIPDDFENRVKTLFEKYKVNSFKKTGNTPISKELKDFPLLKNERVTTFKLDLAYPIISEHVYQILTQCIYKENLLVRSLKQEDDLIASLKQSEEKSAQDKVGNKGVSEFLKTLMKMRDSKLTKYEGINDQILAKSEPVEKTVTAEHETSSISPLSKALNPNPRKGNTK